MIVFENAKKTYATGRPAIDGVSFTIPRGQFCVLLGHSGAGKSTLLRLVNGLTELTSGGITVDSLEMSKPNLGLIRKKVSMIHQGFNLSQRSSVAVNVMSGALAGVSWFRALAGAFPSSIRGKACEALNRVGLREEHLHRRVDSLSGGQQQRVGIARALIMDPIVMLADEPISSLDPSTSRDILRLLRDAAKERTCTVLCSLHQVDLAKEFADRIIGIDAGRVVFDLRPEEVDPEVLSLIYRNYEDPLGANTLASCSLENLVEPRLRNLVKP